MNELTTTNQQLPTTLEDLSRFVLVGREKLKSVRAEIVVIEKLELAQEVRQQKREECLMLSEALLDAEARLGVLMNQIPKATEARGNQHTGKWNFDTTVDNPNSEPVPVDELAAYRTKREAVERLGFSQKQAERFEILADNPDVIEQVKAEARENDDIPTRTRVLDLVREKKRRVTPDEMDSEAFGRYIDGCKKQFDLYLKAIHGVLALRLTDDLITALREYCKSGVFSYSKYVSELSNATTKIHDLQAMLANEHRKGGFPNG